MRAGSSIRLPGRSWRMPLSDLADLIAKYEGSWESHAACADLDSSIFFPVRGASNRKGKQVCGTCPVRTECLAFALESRQKYGIWGGLTGEERRAYLRRTSDAERRARKRQELEEARETYGKPGHVDTCILRAWSKHPPIQGKEG